MDQHSAALDQDGGLRTLCLRDEGEKGGLRFARNWLRVCHARAPRTFPSILGFNSDDPVLGRSELPPDFTLMFAPSV